MIGSQTQPRRLLFARARTRALRPTGLLLALAALVVLAPAAESLAQRRPRESKEAAPDDKTASQDPAYRAAIEEALHEFDLGNWNEALVLFQKAHAIAPNARTLRGIGFCLFENRRYVDAMRHLEQSMVDTRHPLTPAQRTSTQRVLERAAAFVGHVTVQLSPREAKLSIDGQDVQLPDSGALLLDPGEHELSASAAGHAPHSLRVQVESGRNEPFKLELSAAAPEPAAVAEAAAPPPAPRAEDLTSRDRLKRGLMIGGFTLAGAALVSGAVTGIMTITRKGELEDKCPDFTCPEDQAGALDKAEQLALVSSISFGVAALGAGLGLTGLLLPRSDERSARRERLRIALSPRSLTISGVF